MLTINDFCNMFPKLDINREEFLHKSVAKYSVRMSLYTMLYERNAIVTDDDDFRRIHREWIVDTYYKILIVERDYYLRELYDAYFRVEESDMMNDKEICDGTTLTTQVNDRTKNIIRNLFFVEIMDLTRVSNTTRNAISFLQTMIEIFNDLILPDRVLAPSTLAIIKEKGDKYFFHLLQQYLPKASILNPYTIKYILNTVPGKNLKLCSMVLSWGVYKYVYGFLDQFDDYVGVDVMPSVCKKVDDMLCTKSNSTVCCPSEKLHDFIIGGEVFTAKYNNYFDVIICCPPYYKMEIYHEGEQSTTLYTDYDVWLENYWHDTMKNIMKVLKPGGKFMLIINDYKNLSKKSYNLINDFNQIITRYLHRICSLNMKGRAGGCRTVDKCYEQLMIYSKSH